MTYFENGNNAKVEKNGLAFFVERRDAFLSTGSKTQFTVRPASQVTGGQTLMEIQTIWEGTVLTSDKEDEIVDKLIFDLTSDIFSAFELAYEAGVIRKDLNPDVEDTTEVLDKIMDRLPNEVHSWAEVRIGARVVRQATEGT